MAIVIAQPQSHHFQDTAKGKAPVGGVCSPGRYAGTNKRRVMQIAVGIFNLTRAFARLDARHRRMLKLAALLHDVGRLHGADKHHIHGSRMVRKSRTLELRPTERLAVAFLARHHRGQMPDAREEWSYPKLESPRTMQLLLSMLRAADTLDSRHIATPAVTIRLKGERLRVRCFVEDEGEAESAFVRPKKFLPAGRTAGGSALPSNCRSA